MSVDWTSTQDGARNPVVSTHLTITSMSETFPNDNYLPWSLVVINSVQHIDLIHEILCVNAPFSFLFSLL